MTNQSNATREHLKVLTSYNIGTRNRKLTTDLQTLRTFSHVNGAADSNPSLIMANCSLRNNEKKLASS